MRWARLFADLDAQLEAADRAERAAESAELRRLELSRVSLAERCAGAVGAAVGIGFAAGDAVTGVVIQAGADWLLVDTSVGGETLVAIGAVASVTGLPAASTVAKDEVDRRRGLGSVIRRLARDRAAVSVVMRDGAAFTGTIDRVGADFFDLAEHACDLPRRAGDVQRVRTVAFAGVQMLRPA